MQGLRAILLLLIVSALSVIAIFRPRIGLYGYLWFGLMRPDVLAFSYGTYPYSVMLAVTTLIGSLPYLPLAVQTIFTNPFCLWQIALLVPITLSVAAAIDPSLSTDAFSMFLRVILMACLIPVLIRTEKQFRILMLVIAMSLGLLGSKFGVYGLRAGGTRFSEGYGGMMSDNNCLALALVMGAALCWGMRPLASSALLRLGLGGMAIASSAGAIMTYSRGAALALVATFLVLSLRSKHRLFTLCLLILLSLPAVYMVGDSYVNRLSTIKAPAEEASARSHMENYAPAIEIWKDYPIFGVGFGEQNQRNVIGSYLTRKSEKDIVIHNTYLQILVDSGLFAFLIYCGLLIGTLLWLSASFRRARRETPGLEAYPAAIQSALIGFCVGATFLSRVQLDLVYILLMCAGAWWNIQRNLVPDTGEEEYPEASAVLPSYALESRV